jgi:inner membrane transporter RhtA
MLASLEPVFAALSGLVFLQEVLSLTQWLAIAAIIVASIGTTLSTPTQSQLMPAD